MQIDDTTANLKAGARLAFLLPSTVDQFRLTTAQAFLLVVLGLILDLLFGYAGYSPLGVFVSAPLWWLAALSPAMVIGCWAIANVLGRPEKTAALVVVMAAARAVIVVALFLVDVALEYGVGLETEPEWTSWVPMLWCGVVAFAAVRLLLLTKVVQGTLLLGVCAGANMMPLVGLWFVLTLWHTPRYEELEPRAEFPRIDVEQVFYAQPELMSRATTALAADRPGLVDLYFVGFAGYAHQDVFLREVQSVADIFAQRFDAGERSVVLVNNAKTAGSLPLANASNLSIALDKIGERMNPSEDVLFLFLTSHGSRDHRLSVNFYPLSMNDIGPDQLRTMLDRSGIKWRVVVVSACYSGGFVDALRDDHSLIITAARHDRTSFGCSHEREFTYFGQTFFNEQLRREVSFITAFEKARQRVTEWELAEKLAPSEPQIHMGAEIRAKLEQLESRLSRADGVAFGN